MNCVICKEAIIPNRDREGNVYWSKGNNALPVKEGRCCDLCNLSEVIPARLSMTIPKMSTEALVALLAEVTAAQRAISEGDTK